MLHIWSNYHNVIIWYHTNMLITLTKNQACCTLRIPFDIVVDALFNRGCHPIQPLQKNICFYKSGRNSGHKWVPRHDSDGIRGEISREKKMSYLPGLVDLQKSWNKNNVEKVDPKKQEKKQCRKSGPPKSLKKTMSDWTGF